MDHHHFCRLTRSLDTCRASLGLERAALRWISPRTADAWSLSGTWGCEMEQVLETQAGESEEVDAFDCLWQPLVVFGKAPGSGGPGERSLHAPPSWQEDEPRLACANLTTTSSMPCSAAASRAAVPE